MAALTKWITEAPNQVLTLNSFCERFGTAKSTLSEDVNILRRVFDTYGLGTLETVVGAAGGVRYRPGLTPQDAAEFINGLCQKLNAPSRLLPGGFLYLSDVLSAHDLVSKMGVIIAGQFYDAEPDFILTMETKGIPVALMTAQAMGLPLVIARRSGKVYEGPAVNINYISGSSRRIETMSLSRRAVREGQKALIVDDFLQAGGTARGMIELMNEFGVEVIGSAFVMATKSPLEKLIHGEKALMVMDVETDVPDSLTVRPAEWLTAMVQSV